MTEAKLKEMHIGFPRDYIALTRGFTSSHRGIDMAWNSQYGGQNAPVYAPADGVVYAVVDGKGNTYKSGKADWGNLVKIKHADGVYTLMAHLLKGSILVKKGDKVSRGQMVAKMNNSGYSNGSHVHYELYWDKNGDNSGTKFRVDPLKYCYAYPEDTVNASTQKEYGILHYAPPSPIKQIGTPVARNKKVNQIEVKLSNLRARVSPSTSAEVLGYVNEGIYDVKESVTADGYRGHKVENFWCAQVDKVAYYQAEPEPVYRFEFPRIEEKDKAYLEQVAKNLGVQYTVTEL